MGQLWWIVGAGMAPFVISVIFSTTHCGAKKIAWGLDVLAIILGLAVYFMAQGKTETYLFTHLGALGVIVSCIIGYIAMALFFPLLYVILHALPAQAPRQVAVEAPAGHGHGDHGHGAHGGHGHDAHGGGHGHH